MARTVRDGRIDSRSVRLKLAAQAEPHWLKIAKGCYLGYRRHRQGGTWVARFRHEDGRQAYTSFGPADDAMDADGVTALSFEQAQKKAQAWFQHAANGTSGRRGTYTVADCMADYLDWVKTHRKSHAHLKTYVNAFILPKLGRVDCAKLTARMIRSWHQGIADEPPRLRTKAGETDLRYGNEDTDPAEALRKRRLRANRHLVTLRAALTKAWREGHIASNEAWARLQLFPGTEKPRSRFLTTDEARRLINTCPPDLRRLVQLALLTGARYGELSAFDVRDFQPEVGTLHVRQSKSGKPRHIILNAEGTAFCRSLVLGRPQDAPLLVRADGSRWARDLHFRGFKDAVRRAGIDSGFTFHELRHTWASLTIMAGAPLMVVAQNLGHRDTRMVERHYGHLADTYVVEMIRKSSPSFGIIDSGNVVPGRVSPSKSYPQENAAE
ncbi:site-specific integrase [Azospirillum sp.]|uniref:tyrosine-type recombinase/integrase n=1 Tax=Azospirillum sp. TaxID=34012 RepID=UPI002D46DF29|nr:site-specific integrase [Azospirillum sp.]HYD64139.1 site-specific integrase [Azospirillum sp.]